ncbi:hypothetical protein [Desulfoluna spongiiphila]|uniref:Uncharacterized protein n=1 Tax=Desulfoluna spongiiphila TaxID=419481 RepID=A0A1G5B0J2_9BACT|nr:hypothetical protein [Desulfoluna spongiiphila]SCX83611.1 hypothetical protein SAMN05216233_101555 [Desulfoluna spongiiphila]
MDGAPAQQARITQAIRTLPPEMSGFFISMDRKKHYPGNPDSGIPAMTYFTHRKRVPRGMLKAISTWFSGNDAMKESRPEWGEYYATVPGISGGEMCVSMRVRDAEGCGNVEVAVEVEITHSIDDENPVA